MVKWFKLRCYIAAPFQSPDTSLSIQFLVCVPEEAALLPTWEIQMNSGFTASKAIWAVKLRMKFLPFLPPHSLSHSPACSSTLSGTPSQPSSLSQSPFTPRTLPLPPPLQASSPYYPALFPAHMSPSIAAF